MGRPPEPRNEKSARIILPVARKMDGLRFQEHCRWDADLRFCGCYGKEAPALPPCGGRHKVPQVVYKVPIVLIIMDEPGSSKKHRQSNVEETQSSVHVPSDEIHSRSTLPTTVQYPGENSSLSLSSAGPRSARQCRVAVGLHNSPGPLALGKQG